MRRLLRLLAITAGMAVLLSGTVVAFAALGGNAVHHVASAQELPLPPITSRLQEPSTVYAADGKTVLATLSGPEFRQPVTLSQVSKTMVAAVLDTEDHGFYVHGGFDIPSMVRALVTDASGQGFQGGSTIPQQLVKQLYLSSSRTINRKIREAVLADRLEQKYSKDQILQAYLNTIYLGSGAYGVQAAAQTYFGIPASKLNLAQSALLAGMIQNPNGYDPILSPAAARDRRGQVLQRMLVLGDITPAQKVAADKTPLPTSIAPNSSPTIVEQDPVAGYYVNQVKDYLLDSSTVLGSTYAERYASLFEGGLKIVTNLDPTMQAVAEQAVANDTPANKGGFEEGLVSIDPSNGAVRALVGGTGATGASAQQFDVMTQGLRQPGSGFKLFTLLTALEQGYSVYDSVDKQGPCAILFPGNSDLAKKPIKNDDGPGGGVISLVQATAGSVNCAYIRLAHEVGLHNVISTAQALGISPKEVPHSTYDYIPSVVIGAAAVRPIEMAGAYAAVAAGGIFHTPSFINTISDRTGNVVYQGLSAGRRVFSAQVAAEADVALRAVVTGGTGTAASLWNRPVAGKTGTTENNVDAWFNGFTPQLETTVWMGNLASDNVPIYIPYFGYVYGANFPARTWHDYSGQVLANQPVLQLPGVEYSLLPATKYITSQSLVRDDVIDHNGGYYSGCYNGYYNGYGYNCYGYNGSPGTASPTTIYVPPATTPATQPTTKPTTKTTATTSPPKTTATTAPAKGPGKP
ncbi:MAG TPA: transglycosylase domain-containing protein [Acidimicrobiales bacterium]|nr:transglycosylase domain-containing protein [Acidimicrobiales bacterium]